MKLWLDISRHRHISFAAALTKVLTARGHTFVVTASEPAFVERLKADVSPEAITLIQSGRSLRNVLHLAITPKRVLQLANWARHQNIDMALSLDNPIQALSGRLLRLKVAALLENPHDPEAAVIRRTAHLLGLPTYLSGRDVDRLRLHTTPIVWRYEDAPEATYFDGFKPNPPSRVEFLKTLGWGEHEDDEHLPIVVYHSKALVKLRKSHKAVLETLSKTDSLTVLLPSPNYPEPSLEGLNRRQTIYSPESDVPTLLTHADLVISDGTTLLKEAALLGTPSIWLSSSQAYNRLGHFIDSGRIRQVASLEDAFSEKLDLRPAPAHAIVSHLASDLVTQLESAFEIL